MPRVSATRRASYTSSSEQQRPCTDSGIPSCPARRRWFHNCMVSPITECPSARNSAATAEESTPPDMATAIVLVCMLVLDFRLNLRGLLVERAQFAQSRNRLRHQPQRKIHIL